MTTRRRQIGKKGEGREARFPRGVRGRAPAGRNAEGG